MSDIVRVAAFDLDGTIIDGESPFILTRKLLLEHEMKIRTGLKLGVWGIKYRCHLPQKETKPRELLFSTFTDRSVEDADAKMMEIFDKKIAKRVKEDAAAEIKAVKELGMVPIIVSASFKPLTDAFADLLGFAGQISTVMEEKDGSYTARVDGNPVQGKEKLDRLTEYCDERWGEGNWILERAYGDHRSDIPLLSAALCAFATSPDRKLKKTARRNGWAVLDWE